MSVNRIETLTHYNKKNSTQRLYALVLNYPHKKEITLINHIEYGFIFDGILNQAMLNIFERKNIHPEYHYSSEELLNMLSEQRAKLLVQNDFSSLEQLNTYCDENFIDIISTYELMV